MKNPYKSQILYCFHFIAYFSANFLSSKKTMELKTVALFFVTFCMLNSLTLALDFDNEEEEEIPESAKKRLPCEKLQRCLNIVDRNCWGEFYEENKDGAKNQSNAIVNLIFHQFTRTQFLSIVDKAEADHHHEFVHADETFAECMGAKGYRNYIDYCSDQRPVELEERKKRDADSEDKPNCWKAGIIDCMNKYPFLTKRIANDMMECDKQFHITENETAVAKVCGEEIMSNVLQMKPVQDLLNMVYAVNNGEEEAKEAEIEDNQNKKQKEQERKLFQEVKKTLKKK